MYYEWYIDLFFLENVIMDGILLILVGIAMDLRHSALRLLLAAAEGGAGACILALLPVENGAAALLLQGGLAALMVKTGFPVLNGKRLIGGIAWLYGREKSPEALLKDVSHTIVNTLAVDSGIVCDGAKASCAAKIASAVDAGLLGFYMYQKGQQFRGGDGIISKGVEETIRNIGLLATQGMRETDREILDIMTTRC